MTDRSHTAESDSGNAHQTGPETASGPVREQIVVTDKRKIDSTGRPKSAAAAKPEEGAQETVDSAVAPTDGEAVPADEVLAGADKIAAGMDVSEIDTLRAELGERLQDLQRVTAEYANYRKRVERDRNAMAEQAIGLVISGLIPILDDMDRAREHGDLVGPFGAVAEKLRAALAKFGLTDFGEKGDPFDPTRHEAVAHQTSTEVTEPTCVEVMRQGYLLGERLLRPALVAVADPQ